MSIQNALAGVAVQNLDAVIGWYDRVLGSAGRRPMPEVAEWRFARGGSLQVFQDVVRAGRSSVTLVVPDLEAQVAAVKQQGVTVGKTTHTPAVKTAIVHDPDGNQIVFAQPMTDQLAQ